ncbi:MAG: hypothetical protein PVF74_06120 [Anaerolineales bacterium]|jgi:hypothetical protein
MRVIRASEIGSYVYCNRAWWYQKNGQIPENLEAMVNGQNMHTDHGRRVMATGCLRTLAYLLFLLAIIAATAYITSLLI